MLKRLPAEWERQEALLLVFPTIQKDWQHSLKEIQSAYLTFINIVKKFQRCIILCHNKSEIEKSFTCQDNLEFVQIVTDDTWIRDFGIIDFYEKKEKKSYDFIFNAWGDKFASHLDNNVNQNLYIHKKLQNKPIQIDFILEGGSIDSNGAGVLLSTEKCLLNKNRNAHLSKGEVLNTLTNLFGLKQIIMLKNGFLSGDDTDSHIDTLARFLDEKTIAYVKCYDKSDEHFKELTEMEKELEQTNFTLFPLPLPKAHYFDNHRLPATYLNFVFINNALIVPLYNDDNDTLVLKKLQNFFPKKRVIGVDASVFIREHGSLHCSCMNIYKH